MRNTDEQLKEIYSRAEKIRTRRRARARMTAAVCVCLVLIAALGIVMPAVRGEVAAQKGTVYGSLVLTSPALGFIVIGVLAFALGVCVTLLCMRYRGDEKNRAGK